MGKKHATEILVQLLTAPLRDGFEQSVPDPACEPVQGGDLTPSAAGERDDLPAAIGGVGLTGNKTCGLEVVDRRGDVTGIEVEAAGQLQLRRGAFIDRSEHRHVTQAHPALGETRVELLFGDLRRLGQQIRRHRRKPLGTISELRHAWMIWESQWLAATKNPPGQRTPFR